MPTTSSPWALQSAAYTALIADTELMGQVKAIHHYIPENSAYPYVLIRAEEAENWSTVTTTGTKVRLVLLAVTRDRTPQSTLTILARIRALLHNANLSVMGGTLVNIRYESSTLVPDKKNQGYEGEIRFNSMIEGN